MDWSERIFGMVVFGLAAYGAGRLAGMAHDYLESKYWEWRRRRD